MKFSGIKNLGSFLLLYRHNLLSEKEKKMLKQIPFIKLFQFIDRNLGGAERQAAIEIIKEEFFGKKTRNNEKHRRQFSSFISGFLSKKDDSAQSVIIDILVYMGAKAKLFIFLDNASWNIRKNALDGIKRLYLGEIAAGSLLKPFTSAECKKLKTILQEDECWQIRSIALELININSKGVKKKDIESATINCLSFDEEWSLRRRAAELLTNNDGEESTAALMSAVKKDPKAEVREAALSALIKSNRVDKLKKVVVFK